MGRDVRGDWRCELRRHYQEESGGEREEEEKEEERSLVRNICREKGEWEE